jgi:hypothetical protein
MKDIRIAAITFEAPVGEIDDNLERTVHLGSHGKTRGRQPGLLSRSST